MHAYEGPGRNLQATHRQGPKRLAKKLHLGEEHCELSLAGDDRVATELQIRVGGRQLAKETTFCLGCAGPDAESVSV